MQKLYTIIYPCKDIAKSDTLYFRGSGCIIDPFQKNIYISQGCTLSSCTYFNAFSLDKWHKYTNLRSLFLRISVKGKCRIDIYTKYLVAGDYLDKRLATAIISEQDQTEKVFDLSSFISLPGLLYFEISSIENTCIFYSGEFYTDDSFSIPCIGIIICTYKREKYIEKFISNFRDYQLTSNLYAFIADNGSSLPSEYASERIFIFKNKNYGGAGGFTRGMIEIKRYNQSASNSIQYILLMDDDIVIDFQLFERLTAFLALRKEEYENYFIAGSMCSLDYPYLQYERMASWRGDRFLQSGASYDLRDINTIVTNEREDQLRTCSAGWWFSCFSEKILTPNNYPFPCFFRGDDMEFTMRNGSNIITLNGLCVWHEPFYRKYSIVSENYYLYRNTLVINALYRPDSNYRQIIKYLLKRFSVTLVTYDYQSAILLLKAWKDYCKGVVFFETTDPEKLNIELSKFNYKMTPIQEIIQEYRFEDINYDIYQKKDRNKLQSIIRHITINGFLIPKLFYHPFDFALVGFGARYINFYKVKNVFNFDPFSQRGYYTCVSKIKAIKLMLRFIEQAISFKFKYKKIQADYQANFYKLQTEDFWKKYLDIQ